MPKDKLFYIGIKGLIENEKGELLLLRTIPGPPRVITDAYWDFPGGRMQPGQSILETLKTEVEEETGQKISGEPEFLQIVISNHVSQMGEHELGLALLIYKVNITDTARIIISEEHDTYEWVDKKEAAERLQHKYPKEFTDAL